jgi:outer membrane receptor protein involved in Fe transport
MTRIPGLMTPLALAIAALSMATSTARAQDAAPAAPAPASAPAGMPADKAKTQGLDLATVVVTGTSAATSKMKSSISVSSISGEQIAANQPQNASDVLTAIPGLFVQSSGGGGNANVSVRGMPISAGGSRYLQFQEDGLPVLLFGDIAFGNPDDFVRMDASVDRVEAVRGGSAAVLATNGPGGIVNFITKTGDQPGGSIGLTTGLGFRDDRLDFSYGGRIAPKTRFFIGGYYESGQGPRVDGSSAIQGGQIKGNITQEFDNGYVRLNFKALKDQQPMYMPGPVAVVNGKIQTVPGIDPRKYTGYSPSLPTDTVLNNDNTTSTINMNNGMVTNSTAIGLETHLRLSDNWVLDDKFRRAANSGQWAAWYPGSAPAAAAAGTTYANGAQAGQAYTGLAMTNVAFDVNVKDLGNTTNDLKLTKSFDHLAGGKLTAGAGLFLNQQNVDLVWNFNGYLTTVSSTPAPLNNAAAGATSYGYEGPGFGGCCSRDYEGTYRTTSPYVFATYEAGPVTIDGGVREDNQKASGYYNIAAATSSTAGAPLAYAAPGAVPIDYSLHRTEYSLGGNFQLDKNVAVFARYSQGASFNADRIMDQGPLSGSATIPINTTKELEGGVKAKLGAFSGFVTLFNVKTSEFNYSATTQAAAASKYDASGIEIEAGYQVGGFHLESGLTYTDSTTKASTNATLVGLPANRQPKLIYQIGPSYDADKFSVGVNFVGVTSSKDTDTSASATQPYVTLPGYMVTNGHVTYNWDDQTTLTLGFYNLFNRIAYTEVDSDHAARSLNGRVLKASLTYTF